MADFNSKYSGEQVEALLDQVAGGNAGGGGGGGIAVETDPIFSASPAATITEADKSAWNGKQDAISDLATIRAGAAKGATAVQPSDISEFLTSEDLAKVATSGSYNDLVDTPAFKTINGESVVGSGDITIAGGSGEKGDKGDKGDTGVGVQSVKQTTISNTDGGSNVVTVTLTNGATSTFTVKNGSKGSQGIQGEQGPKGDTGATGEQGPKGDKGDKGDTGANGTNGKDGANGTDGKDGADGADGATFTPSVDAAGNLSWTNNKGLTNPPTVNIKGPKGDKGDAGEGGGGTSGGGGSVETISLSGGIGEPLVIEEMLAEKRYYLYVDGGLDGNEESIVIWGFEGDGVYDGTHIRHFYAVIECVANGDPFNVSLSLPDVDIRWANGTPIPIRGDGRYELSITQVSEDGLSYYNGVLTSFS